MPGRNQEVGVTHREGDTPRMNHQLLSVEEVDRRLVALGIDPEKLQADQQGLHGVSKCVRAAIQNGFIKVAGKDKKELEQVVYKGEFDNCGHPLKVKLRDVLYQQDWTGCCPTKGTIVCQHPHCQDEECQCQDCLDEKDEESEEQVEETNDEEEKEVAKEMERKERAKDEEKNGGAKEEEKVDQDEDNEDEMKREKGADASKIVLTRMCFGEPQPDCGKFHNHCVLCPGFGMCIDDYRYAHCNSCGDHFRAGLSGLQYTPNGWRQVGSQCDECCDDEGSEDESSDEWEDYEDESSAEEEEDEDGMKSN